MMTAAIMAQVTKHLKARAEGGKVEEISDNDAAYRVRSGFHTVGQISVVLVVGSISSKFIMPGGIKPKGQLYAICFSIAYIVVMLSLRKETLHQLQSLL
jgi:hypothetical protein